MHKSTAFVLGAMLCTVLLTSCSHQGANIPEIGISRLYVSNADADAGTPNLEVYDPADEATLGTSLKVASGAKDGNGIVWDIQSDLLFQAGRSGRTIYYFRNASDLTATSTPSGSFTDASLSSARDIAYDNGSNALFVANNTDSTLRIYSTAPLLSGNVTGRTVKLSGQPWGLFFDQPRNRLLVLMDLAAMRIEVFNNPSAFVAGPATPASVMNITNRPNGATKSRLHGLTYSSLLDVLMITEIGEAAAPATPDATKPAFNADGGIYIFEGAAEKLSMGGNYTATRIIYGSNTMLGNPVDIAFDERDSKRMIYVAEKANKKILVFKLTDSGNASPTVQTAVTTMPEAIYLDAQ